MREYSQVTLHHIGKGGDFGQQHSARWSPVTMDKKIMCVKRSERQKGSAPAKSEKEDVSVGRQ